MAKIGLAALTFGGASLVGGSWGVLRLQERANRACYSVIIWCTERIGENVQNHVIDCSYGPFAFGEGMFPWIQAERGSLVRVLDLNHELALNCNPARAVIPQHSLRGDIQFQVAATHRLIPTSIQKADWLVMICTLQLMPPDLAQMTLDQALDAARKVLLVETSNSFSIDSLAIRLSTTTHPAHTHVTDLLPKDVIIEEKATVGPFTCYIVSKDDACSSAA
ncbi:hypothetical protein DIPPA_11015 [Diplonema papillatum]|nr:hypothetical protein DIPPA_11015 [Diplonema papillatum]